MDERTEDLALRRVLPLSVGGETVELRTLTIDESDVWLSSVAAKLAEVDLPDTEQGSDAIAALMTWSGTAVLGLVTAYDRDGKLGEDVRSRMTKQELKAAMDAMVTAEDPFGEAVARSVAVGFGAPSRFLASGMRMVLSQMIASRLGDSTTGLGSTASTIPASEPVGAASSSSSDGRIPKHAKRSG